MSNLEHFYQKKIKTMKASRVWQYILLFIIAYLCWATISVSVTTYSNVQSEALNKISLLIVNNQDGTVMANPINADIFNAYSIAEKSTYNLINFLISGASLFASISIAAILSHIFNTGKDIREYEEKIALLKNPDRK
ncbi:MAG: hypothetical protein HFE68_00460 [Erysipelotrichaceae bacterium]|nr:hypothetical protein [Erysipelotrichaceae bacterium]MCI9311817.1 hypothetical protein [Erysipelotrichaceae bacterium]